jgi:hypothetical protein
MWLREPLGRGRKGLEGTCGLSFIAVPFARRATSASSADVFTLVFSDFCPKSRHLDLKAGSVTY